MIKKFMLPLLMAMAMMFFVGCDDGSSDSSSSSALSTPSWIQGTWEASSYYEWEFTSGNAILYMSSTEYINIQDLADYGYTVSDTTGDYEYNFTVSYSGTTYYDYTFTYDETDATMTWNNVEFTKSTD
ncbi:MAG: hypothetical protein PQJ59_14790 [Spirochaetales bacterium]|nr:hypothetical protein [Spirochaetales bacterium]